MARTDHYRKQHDDILAMAGKIGKHLGDAIAPDTAQTIRVLLLQLGGKVSMHLAMEDKAFYPALVASTDEAVRSMAREYMDEMGLLSRAFIAYLNKWDTPASISANAPAFTRETKAMFNALAKRIQRENRLLYEMVDALGDDTSPPRREPAAS